MLQDVHTQAVDFFVSDVRYISASNALPLFPEHEIMAQAEHVEANP